MLVCSICSRPWKPPCECGLEGKPMRVPDKIIVASVDKVMKL